ncbi:hypothetical protein OUZ56_033108 [Daphnia magna]|uniref:Uncharacterized protein n=1 Tax=Daphnia magna TaxID=35525 RepID=A0ABR0BA73_9CRUS|nr:hypothetical protein OUZ56_033108 [Daphnia magna]
MNSVGPNSRTSRASCSPALCSPIASPPNSSKVCLAISNISNPGASTNTGTLRPEKRSSFICAPSTTPFSHITSALNLNAVEGYPQCQVGSSSSQAAESISAWVNAIRVVSGAPIRDAEGIEDHWVVLVDVPRRGENLGSRPRYRCEPPFRAVNRTHFSAILDIYETSTGNLIQLLDLRLPQRRLTFAWARTPAASSICTRAAHAPRRSAALPTTTSGAGSHPLSHNRRRPPRTSSRCAQALEALDELFVEDLKRELRVPVRPVRNLTKPRLPLAEAQIHIERHPRLHLHTIADA